MKADIVCLQETHAPSHDTIKKWFANSGYHVVSSCHTNKSCCMAILIKDSYSIFLIIKDNAGRFVQAIVNFGEDQLSFVSLYAPNKNPGRNTFLLSLADLIDLSRPVFLAGDFNSVLDRSPVGSEASPFLCRWTKFSISGEQRCLAVAVATDPDLPSVARITSWAHRLFVDAWVWYLCVPDRYDQGTWLLWLILSRSASITCLFSRTISTCWSGAVSGSVW